jgi:acetyl-CoA C-acetyltransferase
MRSHQRAIAALDQDKFGAEIVPVPLSQGKGSPLSFEADENPRRDTNLAALAALRPVFKQNGTVTAGNASAITDGAAVLVLARRALAETWGIRPLARLLGYAQTAVKPLEIFTAPIFAVRKLAEKLGQTPSDFDLYEINEAFASQCVGNVRELGLDFDRVNVNGGAIALGHPIGASGARLLVTLIHALRQRGLATGLAALCLGGGEAVALAVELE